MVSERSSHVGRNRGSLVTYMNSTRNPSCRCLWRYVSKMDSRIRPAAPAIAKIIEPMAHSLSQRPLFGTNRWEWRNQRSDRNARSKNTTVITLAVMKNGFSPYAPTSEIYLIEVEVSGSYETTRILKVIFKERTQWSGPFPCWGRLVFRPWPKRKAW